MQKVQCDYLTRILRQTMGDDVGEWTPVQNGMKLGVPGGFISVFNSGKIVIQGKDAKVKEFLEKAKARCEAASLEELYAKEEEEGIRYTIHYTIEDIIEKLATVVEGGGHENVKEWARNQIEKLRERDEARSPKPLPDVLNELKERIEAVQKRVENLEKKSQTKKRFNPRFRKDQATTEDKIEDKIAEITKDERTD